MLVDVTFSNPAPHMRQLLLGIAGQSGFLIPERIGQGLYLCGHWSIDQLGVPIRERWRETPRPELLDFAEYGVCDTPEQAAAYLKLEERPERFFISFVKIVKSEESPSGGWRWHKWGSYIGEQNPQCEYIYDEPNIEFVYTYHVYELK